MTYRPRIWTTFGLIAAAGAAAGGCVPDGHDPYPHGHGRGDGGYHGERGEGGDRGERGESGESGERGDGGGERGERGG